ncbi:MAG: DUF898 family protein [Ruminococcaceae bacterium]|nr:DUF898 family protein [Oscillospiraceae bacterium]
MKFCSNCGAQLEDNAAFCPNCGNGMNAQAAAPKKPHTLSDWDGGVLDTVITSIVASIIMGITCGIATPWAVCYMYKFIIDHVLVDGKRLTFDGNGGQLFGNWIKWFVLTIITCGIYSFWVAPRMLKWIASHTHFDN